MNLKQLIEKRLEELGIRRGELVRRMGYSNISKGCRRLDDLCEGDFAFVHNLRPMLVKGLAVEVEVVDATIREMVDKMDAEYRAAFEPFAVVLPERDRPSPIFAYVLGGGQESRIIEFEEGSSPDTYKEQALRKMPDSIIAMGRSTSVIVNYSPDHAVEFDREGNKLYELDSAYRPGEAGVRIGKRWIRRGLFRPIEED